MGHPGNLRRGHKGTGRRRRALERQQRAAAEAALMTPGQRIAALNDRLGKGVGATKERERLRRARRERSKLLASSS